MTTKHKFRDKGIAKLYAAAMRGRKTKKAAPKRRVAKRRVGVIHDFSGPGVLHTRGRLDFSGRPTVVKPKRRKVSKKRRAAPKRRAVTKRRKVRAIVHAAPVAPKRRAAPKRGAAPKRRVAKRRAAPKVHKLHVAAPKKRGGKKPSAKQLAARKRFAEMARERSRAARGGHDAKGPNRRK